MKNNDLLKSTLLFFTIIYLFTACKEADLTDPLESKPDMPPVASMQLDFSTFPENNSLPKITGNNVIYGVETHENWGWAWLHGVAWKTIVTAGMSVPTIAFAESFNHEAVQQEDGRWMWQYTFKPFGSVNHTASLYADVRNDGVNWEMYISKDEFFEDFLWFSGTSDLFGKEGTWVFYEKPENPEPWLGIDWTYNKSDSTGSVKFSIIQEGNDEKGSYIMYGLVTDSIYDAFFDIYDSKKDNLISIKWNRATNEGRIKDFVHYGDNEWHCWDSNLENVDCN